VRRIQRASAATPTEASPAFVLMSRIVIGIMMLLVAVIPWSERYSNLDSFPHGHDAELGILAIFALFGLILLLLRTAEQQLRNLLAVRYLVFLIIPVAVSLPPHGQEGQTLADFRDPPFPNSFLETYNLPLQI